MPSTYTTNLGIEKPATGEQTGTWGTTVSLNYDIFDQAINGVGSVANSGQITLPAAGSTGAPNTYTITDGALADIRQTWIEFDDGGDLGGTAYVQLAPNDAQKLVWVKNSLTASRSIIFFQGTYDAARDYELANGEEVLIKFDGGGASAANATRVITSTDWTAGTVSGFHSIGINDDATGQRLLLTDTHLDLGVAGTEYQVVHVANDQYTAYSGGSDEGAGAAHWLYGGGHATQADDWELRSTGTVELHFDSSGNLFDFQGNDITTTGDITTDGLVYIKERAAAGADIAAYGQLWVKDDTPNTLWFTDDGGTDYSLGTGAGTDWTTGTAPGFNSLGIDDNATGERLQLADGQLTLGTTGADAAVPYTITHADTDHLRLILYLKLGQTLKHGTRMLIPSGIFRPMTSLLLETFCRVARPARHGVLAAAPQRRL
jgi:hypothetical protein